MTNTPEINRQRSRVIRLMLVEDDPVFRLGLITALEEIPNLRIIFEADSEASALRVLQDWMGARSPGSSSQPSSTVIPDLVIVSLDLSQSRSNQRAGLDLCQQLKTRYPNLPVLLIGAHQEPLELAIALQIGIEGFCPKGSDIRQFVNAIRLVARGQRYWNPALQTITQALSVPSSSPQPDPATLIVSNLPNVREEQSISAQTSILQGRGTSEEELSVPSGSSPPGAFAILRRNLRRSGLRQIDIAIALLNIQLQNPDISFTDQLLLTGRRRELRAARRLVNWLLGSGGNQGSGVRVQESEVRGRGAELIQNSKFKIQNSPIPDSPTQSALPSSSFASSSAIQRSSSVSIQSIRAALFDAVANRFQSSLRNLTSTPLEIDILKDEKKRELLFLILRKLEEVLDDLRFSQVQPEQLAEKQSAILQDLWQATLTDFFGKYYTLQLTVGDRVTIPDNLASYESNQVEMVEVLLQDAEIVRSGILSKIPLVPEVLAHLLFQSPLTIDDASYKVGSVEAMARMEILLQNLAIQAANAVMQPLLNRFGNVEEIKRSFYDRRLLSTREIERFRNNLSWRYRLERYFAEPTAIFESRFNLYAVNEGGITKASIYAPRNDELERLSGIPLAVTLVLEARDAIAPRVRSAISFLGSGVVYLLTDVIGRGIGLVGRGIVKGIGNAFQDGRFNRNSERSR